MASTPGFVFFQNNICEMKNTHVGAVSATSGHHQNQT